MARKQAKHPKKFETIEECAKATARKSGRRGKKNGLHETIQVRGFFRL